MALGTRFTLANIVIATVVTLVLIQVANWLLNQFFGLRLFQLGNVILLFIAIVLFTAVAVQIAITKQFQIEKRDILGVIIIAVLVGALVWFMPKVAPQFFGGGTGIGDLGMSLQSIFP